MKKKRERDRQKQLEEEKEYYKNKSMIGKSAKDIAISQNQDSLSFMYAPPPGFLESNRRNREEEAKKLEDLKNKNKVDEKKLEDKFSFLKNAPIVAEYAKNVRVTHKPLGIEVRKVKCARCGEWGHTSGDRECPKRDDNPNESFRQMIEDPLTLMKMRDNELSENLVLKSTIGMNIDPGDPNQQILASDEDSDLESAFLRTLTSKDKKKLLRYFKSENKKTRKKSKRSKSKKKGSSSSSSSESEKDTPRKESQHSDKERHRIKTGREREKERGEEKEKREKEHNREREHNRQGHNTEETSEDRGDKKRKGHTSSSHRKRSRCD